VVPDRESGSRWECIVVLIPVTAILAVTSLASWIAYLVFCKFLVTHTNDSTSLRDAAVAAKAFRAAAPAAIAQAVARLVTLLHR
jgi:hypothetical protein